MEVYRLLPREISLDPGHFWPCQLGFYSLGPMPADTLPTNANHKNHARLASSPHAYDGPHCEHRTVPGLSTYWWNRWPPIPMPKQITPSSTNLSVDLTEKRWIEEELASSSLRHNHTTISRPHGCFNSNIAIPPTDPAGSRISDQDWSSPAPSWIS